jgi:hypothetical protein
LKREAGDGFHQLKATRIPWASTINTEDAKGPIRLNDTGKGPKNKQKEHVDHGPHGLRLTSCSETKFKARAALFGRQCSAQTISGIEP